MRYRPVVVAAAAAVVVVVVVVASGIGSNSRSLVLLRGRSVFLRKRLQPIGESCGVFPMFFLKKFRCCSLFVMLVMVVVPATRILAMSRFWCQWTVNNKKAKI